ncbi:MAG: phage portal protein [Bacteroidota bacterium]|nr:phage portal protein [Bacteroidota bacterium]
MNINEILQQENPQDVINALKSGRNKELPDIDLAEKALNPEKHDINDPAKRKDKWVAVDKKENGQIDDSEKIIDTQDGETQMRIEKVARVRLALQKLIIKRAVAFLFGNEVLYNADVTNPQEEMVMNAFKKIISDSKSNSINRKVARAVFGYKECAELWYPVEMKTKTNKLGFPCKFKLRCAVFSPAFGDTLYPFFDDLGDLIAFSREYSIKNSEGINVQYFETYTDTERYLWQKDGNEYRLLDGFPKKIAIEKIPVVYARQDEFETQDVDSLIDRLELLLSNFADTNDYHASPKIFTTGELKSWSKKGEAGAVIEGEEGATMQYVSWQNAPESVKLEIETLLRMIYTLTQTPDISFESVKGLGTISGIALKLLFMDAHLKVQDKREIFDEYLQRRANIIKSYIGDFNHQLKQTCENMEIEPEITPYMLTNELDELTYWLTANGGKAVISQEEAVEKIGISKNPKATYEKLKEEESRNNSFVISEPVEA